MTELGAYIEAQRTRRFEWGHNDCLTFVAGALRAQGRRTFPPDWVGGYSTAKGALRHYKRLLRATGNGNIIGAMDNRYDRLITLHPSDGDIAARPEPGDVLGFAFGVAYMGRIVFLTEDGVTDQNVTASDVFWGTA